MLIAVGFTVLSRNIQAASGLIMIGMIIFMGNYGVTIGGVSFVLISEIVEPRYISWTLVFIWLSAFIVMFLFPIINGRVLGNNPAVLFYFFACWTFLAFIVNHKFLI